MDATRLAVAVAYVLWIWAVRCIPFELSSHAPEKERLKQVDMKFNRIKTPTEIWGIEFGLMWLWKLIFGLKLAYHISVRSGI